MAKHVKANLNNFVLLDTSLFIIVLETSSVLKCKLTPANLTFKLWIEEPSNN